MLAVEAISIDFDTKRGGELTLLLIEAGREELLDPVMFDLGRLLLRADRLLDGVGSLLSDPGDARACYRWLFLKTGLPLDDQVRYLGEFENRNPAPARPDSD